MNKEAAIGHFRLALNRVLGVFNMYGLGTYIPEAYEEIVKAALLLHERLREAERKENDA